MQKNKIDELKSMCNSAAKRLVVLGLALVTTGGFVACAQWPEEPPKGNEEHDRMPDPIGRSDVIQGVEGNINTHRHTLNLLKVAVESEEEQELYRRADKALDEARSCMNDVQKCIDKLSEFAGLVVSANRGPMPLSEGDKMARIELFQDAREFVAVLEERFMRKTDVMDNALCKARENIELLWQLIRSRQAKLLSPPSPFSDDKGDASDFPFVKK